MTTHSNLVSCAACRAAIDEAPNTPADNRVPCPLCGSTARIHNACVSESVTVRDGLGFKHRRLGEKKPIAEGFTKPTHSGATGRPVEHQRLIDRSNDRYFERVTDHETGATIHHCDEPLSKHTGHGSAKSKQGPQA